MEEDIQVVPDIFDQRLKAIPKSEEITMQSNSSFTYPVTKSSTLTFYCFLSFHAGEIYTRVLSSHFTIHLHLFGFFSHDTQGTPFSACAYIYRLPSISKHCPQICEISSHLSCTSICCYSCGKRMLHANFSDLESINICACGKKIAVLDT